MDVAVTGSHGFIGSALLPALTREGHRPVRIVRGQAAGDAELSWDPEAGTIDADGLEGIGGVVHLAGAGIGDRRWTDARKRLMVVTSCHVLDLAHEGHQPPRAHARGPDAPAVDPRLGVGDRVLRQPR